MLTFRLVLVAATSVLGVVLPEPTAPAQLDLRGDNCGKVNDTFDALEKFGLQGTSFCRSFVNMPAKSTTVVISIPATVTSTTSTTTVTVTSAQCTGQKRDVAAPDLGYEVEYFEGGSRVVQKRANEILPQLQAFDEAMISEACGCLDLRPTTTTVATSTPPVLTTNVVATSTACVVSSPPVCKVASSFSSFCTSGSECCSGICSTRFTAGNCCNPSGSKCDFEDPAACCNGFCYFDASTNSALCG